MPLLRWTVVLVAACAALLAVGLGLVRTGAAVPTGELAFARSTGRAIDLYTLTLPDGVPVARTTGPGTSTSPAWDPTGRWIVYARRTTEPYHLWQLDTATGQLRAVTSGAGIDGHPSVSPDGLRLVFASNRAPGAAFNLHVLTLADGAEQVLTPGRAPAWSPDARRIAFEREGAVWTHDLVTATERRQTPDGRADGDDRTPSWSPDGSRLVFSRETARGAELVVLDLDDGTTRRLTDGHVDTVPAWSPDGDWVAFSRALNDTTDLFAVHVGTGRVHRVTDHERHDVAPAWRPGS